MKRFILAPCQQASQRRPYDQKTRALKRGSSARPVKQGEALSVTIPLGSAGWTCRPCHSGRSFPLARYSLAGCAGRFPLQDDRQHDGRDQSCFHKIVIFKHCRRKPHPLHSLCWSGCIHSMETTLPHDATASCCHASRAASASPRSVRQDS